MASVPSQSLRAGQAPRTPSPGSLSPPRGQQAAAGLGGSVCFVLWCPSVPVGLGRAPLPHVVSFRRGTRVQGCLLGPRRGGSRALSTCVLSSAWGQADPRGVKAGSRRRRNPRGPQGVLPREPRRVSSCPQGPSGILWLLSAWKEPIWELRSSPEGRDGDGRSGAPRPLPHARVALTVLACGLCLEIGLKTIYVLFFKSAKVIQPITNYSKC